MYNKNSWNSLYECCCNKCAFIYMCVYLNCLMGIRRGGVVVEGMTALKFVKYIGETNNVVLMERFLMSSVLKHHPKDCRSLRGHQSKI